MRKKKNTAKIGLAFSILIILLASIGTSYAAWFDTIYIEGTVTTGEWSCYEDETAWARMYNDPDNFTYEFEGSNWATYIIHEPTETPVTFYLYANQTQYVGELYVWKDDNYLYVEYNLEEDYTMNETHLHVAKRLIDIPQSNGNPIPGQFEYKMDHEDVNGYLYSIPWNNIWNNKDLYIAAHAVVVVPGDCPPCDCEC